MNTQTASDDLRERVIDALRSVFSIPSIGGFYAIGGTRITAFDILLVLALLVGIGIPVLHATIRWLASRPSDKPGHRKPDSDHSDNDRKGG